MAALSQEETLSYPVAAPDCCSADTRGVKADAIPLVKFVQNADSIADPSTGSSPKVVQIMFGGQARHSLDPLSPAEIFVAVSAVKAAGATPEVCFMAMEFYFLCYTLPNSKTKTI